MGLTDYTGLVKKTSLMFYQRVGVDREDLEQELWIKVLKAQRSYDPARSAMTERSYVYSLLANQIKDLKRDAARRANGRLQLSYIEEHRDPLTEELHWFDHCFSHASHDEVFGEVEERFVMPATVTQREQEILLLLVVGYDQTEIARQLGVERWVVVKSIGQLREKLADWRPTVEGIPAASAAQAADDAGTLTAVPAAA